MDYDKKRVVIFADRVKPLLLLFFSFSFFWFVIFYSANLPMEGYALGIQIEAVLLFFLLFFSWIKSKRERKKDIEIARLQKKLEEIEKERDRLRGDLDAYFLTWVHQVKTPITAAKLLAEDLPVQEEDFDQKEKIRMHLISIESYTNMALAYLKLVNTDRDLYIKQYSLDEILRPLLKRYSLFFIKNHISLDYKKTNQTLITDGQWLSILIEQIVSNAVKYTKEGRVSVFYDLKKKCLTVKDSGVGIAECDLPKIFNRGYCGFNGALNEKSSGVGLFLAKKIADRLGYRIEAESVLGEGSCFRIYMFCENG